MNQLLTRDDKVHTWIYPVRKLYIKLIDYCIHWNFCRDFISWNREKAGSSNSLFEFLWLHRRASFSNQLPIIVIFTNVHQLTKCLFVCCSGVMSSKLLVLVLLLLVVILAVVIHSLWTSINCRYVKSLLPYFREETLNLTGSCSDCDSSHSSTVFVEPIHMRLYCVKLLLY